SSPYAFADPYLFRAYESLWTIQGLGAPSVGRFGDVNFWAWIKTIYLHIGPLATVLAAAALLRVAACAFRPWQNRAVLFSGVLIVSQVLWFGLFGRLWIVVGY